VEVPNADAPRVGGFFTSIGLFFLCLPDTWIELWFGFDPDMGNGWVEVVITAAPLAIAVGPCIEMFLRYRRNIRGRSVGESGVASGSSAARLRK
jgi:hypothetical protein